MEGEAERVKHQIRMFVLIWWTLLFSVRGSDADTGASTRGKTQCPNDFCVTFSERELTAEAGLSVVILCSFWTADGFTPQHLFWYHCETSKKRCDSGDQVFQSDNRTNTESRFKGRVALLVPDISQKNCSIIINDLREYDSGSYQLRVTGEYKGKQDGFTFTSRATVSVKAWGQQHCDKGFCVTLTERELTAEAGLCVVIPCSFRTASGFTPQHIVWYHCEASEQKCDGGDPVLHNGSNNQSEFRGRVTLLESDISQENCSIIINDLKEADSGSYQLKVNLDSNGKPDRFVFTSRTTVSVKDLQQKPTVMIPTLTEGQQATLTCTAPGLCSGSVPEITWTWRGAGGTESHITGNITALKTENLTAVTQRHVSTLTFNPSAEHHNSNITCKIRFTGGATTEETSTLEVNYPLLDLRLCYLEIIITFVIGVLLSATVCCLAKKCHRKNKSSGNLVETLEMVTHQDDPLAMNSNGVPKEVVYANIDFSLLKRNGAREAAKRQETTKTEYAEIKKAVKEEQEDDGGEEGEILEGKEEQKVMIEVEMKHCEPDKEKLKEEAVYSSVKDTMDEI